VSTPRNGFWAQAETVPLLALAANPSQQRSDVRSRAPSINKILDNP
jgi:hypothetical protein